MYFRRGPLVQSWSMRFEAKHNYFNNFKNIDYSLPRRHQALQTYLLQKAGGGFYKAMLEQGPGVQFTYGDL
jgi:hypothetical protein